MKLKNKIKKRILILERKNEVLKTEEKLGQRLINAFKVNQNSTIIKELKKLIK